MRIAIFLNTSWNIYNFRLSLLKALKAEGHTILCIAPSDEYSQKIIAEGFVFEHLSVAAKSSNPFLDLAMTFRLRQILKRHKTEVLLNYTIKPNIYGTFAAKTLNIRCINNMSGLGTVFLRKGLASTMALVLYKWAFRFPEKVFFQNSHDLRLFVKLKLVAKHRTDILPGSGVDLSKFNPLFEAHYDNTFTFLMPARLLKDKGVYEYAHAAANIKAKTPNSRFILVGKPDFDSGFGVEREDLKKWINEETIEYKGFTDSIIEYYKVTDCVVLPSYREGTSKTLLEALAMGKPIITTKVPGCQETVDHGSNGFLCDAKSAIKLAKAMEQFMELTFEQRLVMAQKSRAKAEAEFDENFVINKYKKAIFGDIFKL
jgi:glycosyltransferase involved in cell wall biosynthesis